MKPRAHSLSPATVVDGKWIIESLLGEGGMGAVYAARHARNGLAVAIKVLHPDAAQDDVVRQRFVHEGYAANRVGHPGTVQVLDDGTSADGTVYLVMERLSGVNLETLAARHGGKLPFQLLLPHAVAWLEVVAAAHTVGIVHRDLKPENVMVCDDGRLKVLDFGLARVREISNKVRLTLDSTPMGTPAFMPPEQALAHWDRVDARADVYALGASLFTLLTDRLVHEAKTVQEMMVKVCTRPAAPIRSIAPLIPPELARIIDRALAFEPDDRYPDAALMLAELRTFAATMRGSSPGLTTLASASAEVNVDAPTVEMSMPAVTPLWLPPGGRQPIANGPTGTLAAGQSPTGTMKPVSSGTERRRRARNVGMGAVGALAVVLAGGTFFLIRANDPGAGPAAAAPPSAAPTAGVEAGIPAPLEPAVLPVASTSASASAPASVAAPPPSSPPSASAAAKPSTRAPSPPPKRLPVPQKPCEKDPFTLRCK